MGSSDRDTQWRTPDDPDQGGGTMNDVESNDERAARVWTALYDYVNAQDRRRDLQSALGLGGGFGRVKGLLHLEQGAMTLRDIAEANGMDAPYATVICDKLAEKGLVLRTPHPDDNRRKLVSLTERGIETADRA